MCSATIVLTPDTMIGFAGIVTLFTLGLVVGLKTRRPRY